MVDNLGKIMSQNARGIEIAGDGGLVSNAGDIDARDTGIYLNGDNGNVTNAGIITTDDEGIFLSGFGSVDNSGVINTRASGIYVGAGAAATTITNSGDVTSRAGNAIQFFSDIGYASSSGSITARFYGIYTTSEDGGIVNSGDINSTNRGICHTGSPGTFRIMNSGNILSGTQAILAEGGDEIINTGALNGETGIYVAANANTVGTNVVNGASGVIDGEAYGIFLLDGDESSVVVNHGSVRGGFSSVDFNNTGGTGVLLVNTGTLIGDVNGESGIQTLRNTGLISGDVALQSGDDIMINGGSVTGDVDLGDNNDLFRATGNGVVSGQVIGGIGNDTLIGAEGSDDFTGFAGNDLLAGHGGDDTLAGGVGNDTIFGGAGDDSLDGGDNADTVNGGSGNDTVLGSTGNDILVGQDGADQLFGEGDNDILDGGAGDDVLEGGDGNDILRGRAGEDDLAGGPGMDLLTGGQDADNFVFRSLAETAVGANRDQILDFEQGLDLIVVAGLSPGVFEFRGTVGFAPSGNPELRLFETPTGSTIVQLDANGDGTQDAEIRVANVTGLTAEDFVL